MDWTRFPKNCDFSLLARKEPDFSLEKHLAAISEEFTKQLGMQVSVREIRKSNKTPIESAFLKSETIWKELVLENTVPQNGLEQVANLKIKLEVDTLPPLGFQTEEKLLLNPFSFYVKCFTLPGLFAGKMHALFVP